MMTLGLVTPARNEAPFIGRTIESVVAQSVRPLRWIIVSDGSTDGTAGIVREHAKRHPWIELIELPAREERSFAGKVIAFNAGYERLRAVDCQVIGSLDADISFDADYFEFLLARFEENPKLGVAGTPFREGNAQYDYRFTSSEHVSGACQLFRRECFESVGGYRPIPGGGIDWVAVTTARMRGWQTRTFHEKSCVHGRPIGTAESSVLGARFKQGMKDYYLGGHPVWQSARCFHQMTRRPYFIGGASLLLGYAWASISRVERPVSEELVRFHRQEQMSRLKRLLRSPSR